MELVKILSISQERTYHTCPRQYKHQRIDQLPAPVTAERMFGRGMHKVLETLNRALRNDVRLPLDFLAYVFRNEMGSMHTAYWEYRMRRLAGFYIDRVAHLFPPYMVEEQFYLDLMPGYRITGIIDIVTRNRSIGDYKVVRKIYPADDRMQEACYYEGMKAIVQPAPKQHVTISLMREDDPVHIVAEAYQVTQKDIDEFWQRMLILARGVEHGMYPKHPSSRWCHPLWCPYYDNPCDHATNESDTFTYDALYEGLAIS